MSKRKAEEASAAVVATAAAKFAARQAAQMAAHRAAKNYARRNSVEQQRLNEEGFREYLLDHRVREDLHGVRTAQSGEFEMALGTREFSLDPRVHEMFRGTQIDLPSPEVPSLLMDRDVIRGGALSAYDTPDGVQYHIAFRELNLPSHENPAAPASAGFNGEVLRADAIRLTGADRNAGFVEAMLRGKGPRGVDFPIQEEVAQEWGAATAPEHMYAYYGHMRDQVDAAITAIEQTHAAEDSPPFRVTFSGHSLGGAMSQFAGAEFGERVTAAGGDVAILNVSGPTVGNQAFAEHLSRVVPDHTRVALRNDPVTELLDNAMGLVSDRTQASMRDYVVDMKPKYPSLVSELLSRGAGLDTTPHQFEMVQNAMRQALSHTESDRYLRQRYFAGRGMYYDDPSLGQVGQDAWHAPMNAAKRFYIDGTRVPELTPLDAPTGLQALEPLTEQLDTLPTEGHDFVDLRPLKVPRGDVRIMGRPGAELINPEVTDYIDHHNYDLNRLPPGVSATGTSQEQLDAELADLEAELAQAKSNEALEKWAAGVEAEDDADDFDAFVDEQHGFTGDTLGPEHLHTESWSMGAPPNADADDLNTLLADSARAQGMLPTDESLTGEANRANASIFDAYRTTEMTNIMKMRAMEGAGMATQVGALGALDFYGTYDDPNSKHYQDAGYAAKQTGIHTAEGAPFVVADQAIRAGTRAGYFGEVGEAGEGAAEGAEIASGLAEGAAVAGEGAEVAGAAAAAEGGLNPIMDAVAGFMLVTSGAMLAGKIGYDELEKHPKKEKDMYYEVTDPFGEMGITPSQREKDKQKKRDAAQQQADAEAAYEASHPYMNYEQGAHGGIDGDVGNVYLTRDQMQAYGASDEQMHSMFDSQTGEARENWVSYAVYTGDVDYATGGEALRGHFQSQEDMDRYVEMTGSDSYAAGGGNTGFGSEFAGIGVAKQLSYSDMAMYQYWLQQDPEMLYGQDWRRLQAMGLDPRLAYDQTYIAEVAASPPDRQREMMFTDDALNGNNAAGGVRTADGNLITYADWTRENNADGKYATDQIDRAVRHAQNQAYRSLSHQEQVELQAHAHGYASVDEYRAAQAQHRVATGDNLQDVSEIQSMLAYQLQNDPNNPFADHLRDELDKAKAGQHVALPGDDEHTNVPPPPPGREIGQEPDQEPGTSPSAPPADANHPDPDNRHMSGMDRLRRDHPEFFDENGHAISPPTQEMVDFMNDPQNQQMYSDGAVDPAAPPPPQNPDLPDDATTDPALDPDKARHDHKTDLVKPPDHLDEMFHKPLEKPIIPPTFDALFETQARTQPALAPILAAPARAGGKSAGGMGQESGQRFHDDIKYRDLYRAVIHHEVLRRLAAARAGA
jgi:hypothetical protein